MSLRVAALLVAWFVFAVIPAIKAMDNDQDRGWATFSSDGEKGSFERSISVDSLHSEDDREPSPVDEEVAMRTEQGTPVDTKQGTVMIPVLAEVKAASPAPKVVVAKDEEFGPFVEYSSVGVGALGNTDCGCCTGLLVALGKLKQFFAKEGERGFNSLFPNIAGDCEVDAIERGLPDGETEEPQRKEVFSDRCKAD